MFNTQNTKNDNKEEVSTVNEDFIPEDIFGRARIAEQMCKYIVETPYKIISPVVLDGPWGSGKTVHVKRMREHFRKHYGGTTKCVYWNAAMNDFSSDPLPIFAAALHNSIPDEEQDKYSKKALTMCYGGALGAAFSIGRQILNAKTGINIKEVVEDTKAGANALTNETSIEKQFSNFLKTASKEKLRIDAARSLVQIVKGNAQNLIIIIDELDRCRPDFALKMIESIKHLFSEIDCKFVLVMNKTSIYSAITNLYGLSPDDAICYLSKYIKRNLQLPQITQHGVQQEHCSWRHFTDLLNKDPNSLRTEGILLEPFAKYVFEQKSLTLRDVEKIASSIDFIQSTLPVTSKTSRNDYFDCLIFFLAYLLTFEHDVATKIAAKTTTSDHVLKTINHNHNSIILDDTHTQDCLRFIKGVFDYYYADSISEKRIIQNRFSKGDIDFNVIICCSKVLHTWITYATFIQ